MAKAKVETNNEYLDASPDMFSDVVQALLKREREAYDALKAIKSEVLDAVKAELNMPQGREVKRTAYTAWGQWQIIVGDVVEAKAKASGSRQSLGDYIAAQQAAGRRV